VHIRGQLEGTSPWHIEGQGSISLLFFDIDVPFSHTWGAKVETALPPIKVMPRLLEELNKLENWRASLPTGTNTLVTLREITATEDLVLHPGGFLSVTQRAIPLNLDLDKVGNQTPSDVRRLELRVTGTALKRHEDTTERFATAQFKKLSDAQKLSQPAFEKQDAGLELAAASGARRASGAVKRIVRYEQIIIDSNFKEHIRLFVGIVIRLFDHFLIRNAASRSPLSAATKQQQQPIAQAVTVQDASFVIASAVDNAAQGQAFGSHAQAMDALQRQVAANPSMAQDLHVIPATEMRRAA
jgi:hypothetical protein